MTKPAYAIQLRPRARRALRQLEPAARQAVASVIDGLSSDPRPPGARAIKDHRPYLRVRSGDYRVIYAVDDLARVVQIGAIGHRRDIYRNLDL